MCTDICGTLNPTGVASYTLFATFTDLVSRCTFHIPLRTRADVVRVIEKALKYAQRQTGDATKILLADNMKEYIYEAARDGADAAGTTVKTFVS